MVKRVIHRRTGEVFAAKFLPLRSSSRTRAFQERDLLSRLAHPRVACLLDFFCTRRTLVLITEMYPSFSNYQTSYGFVHILDLNIISSCCSHGLLDHLLMRGSVSEKEVQAQISIWQNHQSFTNKMNIGEYYFLSGSILCPTNSRRGLSYSQHEHHASGYQSEIFIQCQLSLKFSGDSLP